MIFAIVYYDLCSNEQFKVKCVHECTYPTVLNIATIFDYHSNQKDEHRTYHHRIHRPLCSGEEPGGGEV